MRGGAMNCFRGIVLTRGLRQSRVPMRSFFRSTMLIGLWVLCVFHTPLIRAGVMDGGAVFRAEQTVFHAVAEGLRPSLVRIETVGGAQPNANASSVEDADDKGRPRSPQRRQKPFVDSPGSTFVVADGPTTGLVFSSDGYIITSSFNFVRDPALISVTLADGRRLAADMIARDQVRKIALLRVDATDLSPPTWADAGDVRVGQRAVALGLGFGGDHPSITVGIVSALGRMRGNAIQTDAKLSPANYGGPLCDLDGRVIGLAVPMAQRPGELAGVEMYDAGVGFVVPRHRVDEIVAVLKTGESFYRGWLGVQMDPRIQNAVVVRNLADPSPMREAGVGVGDQILAAEGRVLRNFGHLVQTLYMIPAGEFVTMDIRRGEEEFSVTVRLAKNSELGPLPDLAEPFDPSKPIPEQDEEELPEGPPEEP